MENVNITSSTTLYAMINGNLVSHTYRILSAIFNVKLIYYLTFETSSITKDFVLIDGTYDQVSKVYREQINITVDNGFGYSNSGLDRINITMNIPMKALPFGKGKTIFPCYYQPKINGGRCISERRVGMREPLNIAFYDKDVITLTSKEGHVLPIEHIIDQLRPIYDMFGSPIFDGEIYLYNEKCTSINGAARNPKNPIHDKLAFVIFDIILYGVSQFVRTKVLDQIANTIGFSIDITHLCLTNNKDASGKVMFLHTDTVDNEVKARELAQLHINYGYEGIILRNPTAVYQQGKHVGNLTKIKKQLEGTFRILNIVPKPIEQDQPLFILQNDITDEQFACNPVGDKESLTKYLTNRKDYIGKMVKVTYYERTINNIPFHSNVYPEVMSNYVEEVTKEDNDFNIDAL